MNTEDADTGPLPDAPTMELCDFCKEEHLAGSAGYRECRDTQVQALLTRKTPPVFRITDADREAVRGAYALCNADKDVESILQILASKHPDLTGSSFEAFVGDMPEMLVERSRTVPEIPLWWSQHKVVSILRAEPLPYLTYETEDLRFAFNLQNANHMLVSLLATGARLAAHLGEGYRVYNRAHDEATMTYVVSLRKGKVWRPPAETPRSSMGEGIA